MGSRAGAQYPNGGSSGSFRLGKSAFVSGSVPTLGDPDGEFTNVKHALTLPVAGIIASHSACPVRPAAARLSGRHMALEDLRTGHRHAAALDVGLFEHWTGGVHGSS